MLKRIFHTFSSGERRALLVAAAVFLSSSVSLAVLVFITATTVVPAKGGEQNEGFVGQPSFVNPVLASTEIDRSLVRLLFANVDALAEKIEASDQGRVFRVRLKEHLLWSDGHKLTSDDIIFTVKKAQDGEGHSPLAASLEGVAVSRLSELEVQFNLGAPYPSFAENLKALSPVPKHLFAEIPLANWRLSDYILKPVGSGPYMFLSYEKRPDGFLDAYRFVPNPHYAHDAPLVANFNALFFPNREGLVAAFNGGAVDGMALQDVTTLADIKRPYRSFSFRLPSYYAVFLNQSQNLALKELAVREALSRAAPRAKFVDDLFAGYALPATSPLPPALEGLAASSTNAPAETEGDPAALLEGAGWKMNDAGIREKAVKNVKISLEFTLTVPDVQFLVRTAEMLKEAWKPIGANVSVAVVPFGDTLAQTIKNRNYQAILFGNVLNPPFDLSPFWSSDKRFSPGLNLSLYSNKRVDALLANARKESDEGERQKNFREAARLIAEDVPAIFLYSPDYLYLADKNLKGVTPSLIREPADRFLEANQWYLKTARAWKEKN